MSPFSVDAFALEELAEMLSAISTDPELDHERRMQAAFAAFMVTPRIWPLDHTLFEALLTSSGFDLADAATLDAAVVIGAQLDGSGHAALRCDHTEPSALCVRMAVEESARFDAYASACSGRYDELLNMRRLREMGLRWRAAAASPAF